MAPATSNNKIRELMLRILVMNNANPNKISVTLRIKFNYNGKKQIREEISNLNS